MKIKEIKIREDDGSYSSPIPMGADAVNIDYDTTTVAAELDKLNNDNNTNKSNIISLQSELSTTNLNLATQTARINNIASLDDGSTTGDAELIDIRVGYDNITFTTAGNSVRNQANLLKQTKEVIMPILFRKKSISWINDKLIVNGNIQNGEGFKISEPIEVSGDYIFYDYIYTFGSNLGYSYMFNFYETNTINQSNLISSINPSNAVAATKCYANMLKIDKPANANYLVISVIANQLETINIYDSLFNVDLVKDNSIDYTKLKDLYYCENILTGISNPGIISNAGVISHSDTYKITDFLPVEELTTYYRLNSQNICLIGCYDTNKNWLSRIDTGLSSHFTTPADCKYIKFCDANNSMVNQVLGRYKVPHFIEYNTAESLDINNSDFANAIISKIQKHKLANKNVCILGDSISYGVGATDRNTDSWVALIEKESGANITNFAISGSSLQYRENAEQEAKSIHTLSTEIDFSVYDYVIISAGTNDILGNIGTKDSTERTNACGALNLIIQNILTSNPNCQIIFFTPMFRARFSQGDGHNSDDYAWQGKYVIDLVNKLQETCQKNHIPCKNLYTDFMLNKYNSQLLLADGLHPNNEGYKRLANCILNFLYDNI